MPSGSRATGSLQAHICVNGAKQGVQAESRRRESDFPPRIAYLGNLHREVDFARALQGIEVGRM